MAISVASTTTNVQSGGTFVYNSTARVIVLLGGYQSNISTAVRTLTGCSMTDGSNSVSGQVRFSRQVTSNSRGTFAADCVPHPGWVNGATITLTLTWSGTMAASPPAAAIIQLAMSSTAHPFLQYGSCENTNQTAAEWAVSPTVTGVVSGDFVAYVANKLETSGAFDVAVVPETYTELWDASISAGRINVQHRIATLSSSYSPDIDYTGASNSLGTAIQVHYRENPDSEIVTATPEPFEPGDTVTFTGAGLDVVGAGARLRKVGGTLAYDDLTSFTDTTATDATAVIPNRPSRTPYTSEDGTTHTLEYIATVSGSTEGAPTSIKLTVDDFLPPSGYSRVTIVDPDLSENSLLSALGWTSIAGDQIEWDNAVNVSGTDVTIVVDDDGTVFLDSGTSAMPASVSFKWRAYSTGDEDWTGSASDTSDWATATFGTASTPAISDGGDLFDGTAGYTITGTNLSGTVAVTLKQTGRPNYSLSPFIATNDATTVTFSAIDIQATGIAYGAGTVSVTTAGGTSSDAAVTIAPDATRQYVTLSGHTTGTGYAEDLASANGDQLTAPNTVAGSTVTLTAAGGISFSPSLPLGTTFTREWFDDSTDTWAADVYGQDATPSISDGGDLFDDTAGYTITGTNLASATAVTLKQIGRPNFDLTPFISSNNTTTITFSAIDIQTTPIAYGAASVSVTTSFGTSADAAVTIAPDVNHQYVTLAGHFSGTGYADGLASDNGDQLTAPLTVAGSVVTLDADGTINFSPALPPSTTFTREWFDNSSDTWTSGSAPGAPIISTGNQLIDDFAGHTLTGINLGNATAVTLKQSGRSDYDLTSFIDTNNFNTVTFNAINVQATGIAYGVAAISVTTAYGESEDFEITIAVGAGRQYVTLAGHTTGTGYATSLASANGDQLVAPLSLSGSAVSLSTNGAISFSPALPASTPVSREWFDDSAGTWASSTYLTPATNSEISVLQYDNNVRSGTTFLYNSGSRLIVMLGGHQSNSTTVRTLNSCSLTDGTNSVAGAVRHSRQLTGNARGSFAADFEPHPNWANGATLTLSLTWSGTMAATPPAASMIQLAMSSSAHPFVAYGTCENTVTNAAEWAVSPTVTGVIAGDFCAYFVHKTESSAAFDTAVVPETYTEIWDTSNAAGRHNVQYVIATGSGSYSPDIDYTGTTNTAGTAIQLHYRADGGAVSAPTISDGGDLFDDTTGYTITGTNLSSATAVTLKQAGRPNFDLTPFLGVNEPTSITFDAINIQSSGIAYGAGTVSVTTAGGTSGDAAVTIAPDATRQYVTLAGHTTGTGYADGLPSANGDQLAAPIMVAGSTVTLNADGSISFTPALPALTTFTRQWFDDSADAWASSTYPPPAPTNAMSMAAIRRRRGGG